MYSLVFPNSWEWVGERGRRMGGGQPHATQCANHSHPCGQQGVIQALKIHVQPGLDALALQTMSPASTSASHAFCTAAFLMPADCRLSTRPCTANGLLCCFMSASTVESAIVTSQASAKRRPSGHRGAAEGGAEFRWSQQQQRRRVCVCVSAACLRQRMKPERHRITSNHRCKLV